MTALETALADWHARLDAHAAHGLLVDKLFKARANGKKSQVSKADYEREWLAFNAEEYALKRFATIQFQDLAKSEGKTIKTLRGFRFQIVETISAGRLKSPKTNKLN